MSPTDGARRSTSSRAIWVSEDPNLRSTVERLANAANSSDLGLYSNRRSDADVLIAYALASKEYGALSGKLMALHSAGTQGAYQRALRFVYAMAIRANGLQQWRLNHENLMRVSELALRHHASPVCPHCKGRRWTVAPGAPMLTAHKCPHCEGTGIRKVQKNMRRQIEHIIAALERVDSLTDHGVKRRTR